MTTKGETVSDVTTIQVGEGLFLTLIQYVRLWPDVYLHTDRHNFAEYVGKREAVARRIGWTRWLPWWPWGRTETYAGAVVRTARELLEDYREELREAEAARAAMRDAFEADAEVQKAEAELERVLRERRA